MEFTPKDCPRPRCTGTVDLQARGDIDSTVAEGQCSECGRCYEAELIIEVEDELIEYHPINVSNH